MLAFDALAEGTCTTGCTTGRCRPDENISGNKQTIHRKEKRGHVDIRRRCTDI